MINIKSTGREGVGGGKEGRVKNKQTTIFRRRYVHPGKIKSYRPNQKIRTQ